MPVRLKSQLKIILRNLFSKGQNTLKRKQKKKKKTEFGGKGKKQDDSIEISEEDEKTPQEPTDINSNQNKFKLGKRTFEFIHLILNYEEKKRSGGEMVLPKEVRDVLSQLQVKANRIEKDKITSQKEIEKLGEKVKTYKEQVQVLEKRILEMEGESSEIFKKVEELDETVEDKTREFGEQARLAVSKTHGAQDATEEAKAHADNG